MGSQKSADIADCLCSVAHVALPWSELKDGQDRTKHQYDHDDVHT